MGGRTRVMVHVEIDIKCPCGMQKTFYSRKHLALFKKLHSKTCNLCNPVLKHTDISLNTITTHIKN